MRTHISFPALRATLSHKGRGRTSRCARTSTSRRCAPPSPARGEGEHRGARVHQSPGAARHPPPQGERESIAVHAYINLPAPRATLPRKGRGRASRCTRTSISRRCAPPSPPRGGENFAVRAYINLPALRATCSNKGIALREQDRSVRVALRSGKHPPSPAVSPYIPRGCEAWACMRARRGVGRPRRHRRIAGSPRPRPARRGGVGAQRTQPAITNSAIAASHSTRMRQARAMASRSSGISPKTSAMAVVGVRPDSA